MKSRNLFFLLIFLFSIVFLRAQYISVDTNYTPEQLVKDIFIGQQNSNCISVSNITMSGWDFGNGELSYGYFNKGSSNFEINEGVILSTGIAQRAEGSSSGIQSADDPGWKGDTDLEFYTNITKSTNATILEFDFISHLSNKISFDYLFASEQYLRIGDPGTCGYTDAFAFLIKKVGDPLYTNLAVLPGTNTPITSNNVRGPGGKCPAANPEYFGHFNADHSATNFNGQTIVLTASTTVIPGQKYHIKLVVADQGNGLYDSAVFLKAGSFVGNKDLGPDRLLSQGTALCDGSTLLLDATTAGGQNYQWYRNGVAIPGATSSTYTVSQDGIYQVNFTVSGCTLKGNIIIEYTEKPDIVEKTFSYCDDTLSGSVSVNLQNLNNQIISNYLSSFIVKYYLNAADALAGNNNFLPNTFSLTSNTTLFVRAENGYCVSTIQQLHLKIGNKIVLQQPTSPKEICDNTLSGSVSVNLSDYKTSFTNDNTLTVSYYSSLQDAKSKTNPITNPVVNFSGTQTYYYRFESNALCPQIGSITFVLKSPKKSTILKDQITCPNTQILLDAGSGFDYYTWYNETNPNTPIAQGAATSSILVSVGNYFVDLQSNGCSYRQMVKVTASEPPIITYIEVQGNTATVYVTGGTPPYRYALDNGPYQDSNVFSNIPRGKHTVSVQSADGCYTVQGELIIINLVNVITPNGDGYNDVLDYSDLNIKNNVSLLIFDQYGAKVFQSQGKNYIWDGKIFGKPIPTGTYWYVLEWDEPGTNQKVRYTGWILLKNRN